MEIDLKRGLEPCYFTLAKIGLNCLERVLYLPGVMQSAGIYCICMAGHIKADFENNAHGYIFTSFYVADDETEGLAPAWQVLCF